jgi:hypothetical protein
MVIAGILFWITSITMHKFIMKNPQIKDICKSIVTLLGLPTRRLPKTREFELINLLRNR